MDEHFQIKTNNNMDFNSNPSPSPNASANIHTNTNTNINFKANTFFQQYIPHLIEFRKRLIRSACFVTLLFIFLFYFDESLYSYIAEPMLQRLDNHSSLIATEVTSTFTVPMKLAFYAAVFLAIPYLLFELWTFIAPGLYRREKRAILPILFFSILLFYLGCAFSYFIICPMALQFFLSVAPRGVAVMTDIKHYLDFVLTLLLGGGLAFQVPVITFALIRTGILTPSQLSYLRPYVIVIAFILGMLLTPPDVISQVMLALPMWWLFELGLFLGKKNNKA